MAKRTFRSRTIIIGCAVALLLLVAQISAAAERIEFANGITATIHGSNEISAQLVLNKDGSRELIHPAAGSVVLEAADEAWFPYDESVVIAALDAMQGFETRLDVDVFVLPAPPAEINSSFARRGAVFLSPGTGPIAESTAAYITTHEMGHVMTWAFLDDYPARWDAYLGLRGLDESNLSAEAAHADRAREILAEDIRFLFGGFQATRSGTIENHDLVEPDQVEGLEDLLAGFFRAEQPAQRVYAARAFPNPCNPLTTIEMALADDATVDGGVLRLYDVRGSLIRTIEGHVANGSLSIQWNGTDDFGAMASSGRYFYVFEAGRTLGKGSVTLVR